MILATIVGLIAIKFENETFNETRRKASKSISSTVQKRHGTGGQEIHGGMGVRGHWRDVGHVN